MRARVCTCTGVCVHCMSVQDTQSALGPHFQEVSSPAVADADGKEPQVSSLVDARSR